MRQHLRRAGILMAILGMFSISGPGLRAQEPGEPPPVPGYETPPAAPGAAAPAPGADMTVEPRGPVHEAFAQPLDVTPRPGPVVPKQPPEPIPEVAPDQRPEGDNVVWVPGYWGWDPARNDYLWVSGVWRVAPPGRKWVPGYWNEAESGWQRVPGFWAPADQASIPYLPTPPATLDYGPSAPPPNDNSFYVPGCWVYRDARYLWRPGYWVANRPGFLWNPASYLWTPSGCVYVNGYWDYPLDGRGLLFAPVAFNRPLWNTPGWSYQPNYLVGTPGLLASLFVGPGGSGYYFGDYYGAGYQRLGFRPWFNYGSRYFNPLLTYGLWQNRGNRGWYRGLAGGYQGRFNGTLARPPRTLFQQNRLLGGAGLAGGLGTTPFSNRGSLRMLGPLSGAGSLGYRTRLTTLNRVQRNQVRGLSRGYLGASRSRRSAERARAGGAPRGALSRGRAAAPRSAPRIAPRPGAFRPYARAQAPVRSQGGPRVSGPRSMPRASFPAARPQRAAPRPAPRVARSAPRPAPRAYRPAAPAHRTAPAYRAPSRPAARPAARPAHRPAARPTPRPAGHGGGGRGGRRR